MRRSFVLCLSILTTVIIISCSSDTDKKSEKTPVDSTLLKGVQKTKSGQFEPPDSNYTGDYFEKYASGVIKVRGFFRFGKRAGKWMYFYPNGKLWSEAFFENNKMHGESNVYHPNGKLMYNGHYNMDKADSIWIFYDTIGKQIEQKDYRIDHKKK